MGFEDDELDIQAEIEARSRAKYEKEFWDNA